MVERRQVLFYVGMHLLGVIAIAIYPNPSNWMYVLIGHFLTGCLGISLGSHRLLSHRSYRASSFIKYLFSLLGTLAMQGGPLSWVAVHRAHHTHSDKNGDPHAITKGRFFTHIGWAVHKGPNGFRFKDKDKYIKDLKNDAILSFMEERYLLINVSFFVLSILLLGIETTLYLFPIRIIFTWHITFLINSYSHSYEKASAGQDSALNRPFFALISFGEGFHANHHSNPKSAHIGFRKGQIDIGYSFLILLHFMGLVQLRGR